MGQAIQSNFDMIVLTLNYVVMYEVHAKVLDAGQSLRSGRIALQNKA